MEFQQALESVRSVCAGLPGAEEYLMHGHPSFRAGKKAFAILGEGGHGSDGPTIAVKVDLWDQPIVLEDPRFYRTHYIGQHGWVTLKLDTDPTMDEVERLVVASYRRVAGKKMLAALDTR